MLIGRGFKPPDDSTPNYHQEFEGAEVGLAKLVESAFEEAFECSTSYTAEVADVSGEGNFGPAAQSEGDSMFPASSWIRDRMEGLVRLYAGLPLWAKVASAPVVFVVLVAGGLAWVLAYLMDWLGRYGEH